MNIETGTNNPTWDAEQDHPELCKKLRDGLRAVVDPEIGLDVIALGLIRNLRIEENNAIVKMILTTPFCPYGPAMIEVTQQKAAESLGMPTNIDLSMDMWDFSMMEDGVGADWGLY